jgi:hypothetical protein
LVLRTTAAPSSSGWRLDRRVVWAHRAIDGLCMATCRGDVGGLQAAMVRPRAGFGSAGHCQARIGLPVSAQCPLVLSGGGWGVGDGEADGSVAEVGDEVEASAEGFDVAGDDLEGGDVAVLDLGYPGDAD